MPLAFSSPSVVVLGAPLPVAATSIIPRRARPSLPINQPFQTPRHYSQPSHHVPKRLRSRSFHMRLPSQAGNRPLASRIAAAALKLLIESMCTVAHDVQVDINASSNLALLSGKLNAVTVNCSKLIYNNVSISGGVGLYTDEIALTTASLSRPDALLNARAPTLAKPFSVSVRAALTESDLNRSGPLRDALQTLLNQIVATGLSGAIGRNVGGVSCTLDSIRLVDIPSTPPPPPVVDNPIDGYIDKLLSWIPWVQSRQQQQFNQPQTQSSPIERQNGSIVLQASAKLATGDVLNFDIRAGISIDDDGHLVKLANPQVTWNGISIPILTISMIGVRLDSTTKITSVIIENGILSADGILIISPPAPTSRRLASG